MLHRVPLHILVSPETRQRLQRLRTERHLNGGAWLRALIDEALDREFGPAPTDANEPVAPVTDSVWGTRFQRDIRTFPANLEGITIAVQTSLIFGWILLG